MLSEQQAATATDLAQWYNTVRQRTLALTQGLSAEDMQLQSMPDASPTKWHLAHTTWFFETFVLAEFVPAYGAYRPAWQYLFNSYYYSVGDMHTRAHRGLLSRPSVDEVHDYRKHVDAAIHRL